MNKITLTIALVFGFTIANAQDTTCTFFTGERVVEFDHYTTEIIGKYEHKDKYYDIKIKYGNVLMLQLFDKNPKVRTIITTYVDGSTHREVLDSKDNIYYSPRGAVKLSVGKPKLMIKL